MADTEWEKRIDEMVCQNIKYNIFLPLVQNDLMAGEQHDLQITLVNQGSEVDFDSVGVRLIPISDITFDQRQPDRRTHIEFGSLAARESKTQYARFSVNSNLPSRSVDIEVGIYAQVRPVGHCWSKGSAGALNI